MKKGITLIEITIAIAVIVILSGAFIVAINPGRRIAQSRDNQRKSHLVAIHDAVHQNILMNRGEWNCEEGDIPENYTLIGSENYDLYSCIYPEYLPIPLYDPIQGEWVDEENYDTGYEIRMKNDKIYMGSPEAETKLISIGISNKTASGGLFNYNIWTVGIERRVGDCLNPYSTNGCSRIVGKDPWGKNTILWKTNDTNPPSTYAGEGGIYCDPYPIDNTKLYRISWWEKRVTNSNATYARYYAGLNGYGSIDGVLRRDTGDNTTNPYFWNTSNIPTESQLPVGEWILIVGHVWPTGSGTGPNHPDSGRYNTDGFFGNISRDYVWRDETSTARSRTLSIYRANEPGVIHYTAYPRVDIIDGTEPSIQDLLNGFDSKYNN